VVSVGGCEILTFLAVSDIILDGMGLPIWVMLCYVYGFSNEVVCGKVFVPSSS
jgi:hypothetical protein